VSRIGVAIAIPSPWGGELQQYRRSFGDAAADSIPSHITLVPPTDVDDRVLPDVDRHLADVGARFGPFRLRLRGTATFQPVSPVVFVAVSEGISACELLAGQIRRGPLAQRLQFPFHPHVTVAHDVGDDALRHAYKALSDFECSFVVEDFSMYRHGDDGVWRPVRQYRMEV
jgi:2'-5' RNA ligase